MDLVDASTGRAVQAGSAADRWLRDNAASFGMHRPVKGEAWHIEPVDSEGMREAQSRGAVGFNMNWMDEPGNPEDELASRLRTVMDMLVGDHPEGDAASLTEPASVPAPEALPDSEGFEGGQKTVTPSAGGVKGMVRQMAAQMGWGDDQWGALEELVQRESSWNPNAQNPTSTAFGLFQFLDKTWGKYGKKTSDPRAQAAAGLAYIRDRYGDPRSALSFHDRKGWY